MKHRLFLMALLATASVAHAHAGSFLWAISSDPNNGFVPDQFSSVVTSPPAVMTVATLGNGSLAFNGGLTIGPGGILYGIANDSFDAGSLYAIQANGTISLVGSAGGLGAGFSGGLTFSGGIFYGAVTDFLGNTTLESITASGVATPLGKSLGTAFSGLAYDSANGTFYGISNDTLSVSTLVQFTLPGAVTSIGTLGFGIGGLTYDAGLNRFWAIGNVNNASSQLLQITTAASVSAPVMTLGEGFVELAVQPASAVPEPGTGLLVAFCLGGVFLSFRRRLVSCHALAHDRS